MQETWVWSLDWEDPLEKEMATHSCILTGKSHGQKNLAGYSPWDQKESDMTEQLNNNNNTIFECCERIHEILLYNGLVRRQTWVSVKHIEYGKQNIRTQHLIILANKLEESLEQIYSTAMCNIWYKDI